jgi:hypothetical protein
MPCLADDMKKLWVVLILSLFYQASVPAEDCKEKDVFCKCLKNPNIDERCRSLHLSRGEASGASVGEPAPKVAGGPPAAHKPDDSSAQLNNRTSKYDQSKKMGVPSNSGGF